MRILFVFILLSPVQSVVNYQQCSAKPLQRNPNAEARFSVIISLRSGDNCNEVRSAGIQALVAIDWAVSRLNNVTLVPGVKFGYDVYDDCGIEQYSIYSALDAISYDFPKDLTYCTGNNSQYYLGILGPSRSSTAQQVLTVVNNTDIPVVNPFATFPDLRESKNFFRTVPSDDDQVKLFVELMVKHEWNYVVAMYTNDTYGKNGVTQIVSLAKRQNICVNVIGGFSVEEKFDNATFIDGIIEKLLKHLDNTTNGSLGVLYFGHRNASKKLLEKMQLKVNVNTNSKLKNLKWIFSEAIGTRSSVLSTAQSVTNEAMSVSMASLNIPDIPKYAADIQSSAAASGEIDLLIKNYGSLSDEWSDYTMSIIDGVFAITTALKTAFDTRCKGYKVICEGFDDYYNSLYISHKVESVKNTKVNYTALGKDLAPEGFIDRVVEFSGTGDLIPDNTTPLYHVNVYRGSTFIKVGEYVNEKLVLNSEFPNTFATSICQKGCDQCVETPSIPFEFIEGDVYIVGFFSLHRLSEDPFGCGVFRDSAFDVFAVEAFLNSIKESEETGIKFGGIALDDCYSPSRAIMIISDIFTGKLKIPSDSNPIDPTKIVGVVGPFPSGVTVPLTFLFSSLSLPSISYASTSPDLDDKEINFPYFLRTVPSDVDQAQAMIDILKTMHWFSVGLVYVNNNYGSKGKDAFKKLAELNGICIVKEVEVDQENGVVPNHNAYQGLLDVRKLGTNLLIYFGTEGRIIDLLTYITKESNSKPLIPFMFIGSDDWADSRRIKEDFGSYIEGSITFKIKTRTVQTNFIENLNKKTSSVDTAGYWYKLFFRNYVKCHFKGDFVKTYPDLCSDNVTLSDTSGIMADGRVSHNILAVKALTNGIKTAKQWLCGSNGKFPCLDYKRNIDKVRNYISGVTLLDDNQIAFPVFDRNGNGDVGFQILQIRKGNNGFVYAEVGSFDNNILMFKSENVKSVLDNILDVSACNKTTLDPEQTPLAEREDFRTSDIVMVALLGSLCVVLAIVIFIVVFCFWKKITVLHKTLEETKFKINDYNEITAKRHKQKHAKSNGNVPFDNPIFQHDGVVSLELPAPHYQPLNESGAGHSSHRYDGEALDVHNQTSPKRIANGHHSVPIGERPNLPPRNNSHRKNVSKSESDIQNPFQLKMKMGSSSQPRMGTGMQSASTETLNSQGSVFRNHQASSPDILNQSNVSAEQGYPHPSKSQPSSPLSTSGNVDQSNTPAAGKQTPQSSPLSHNSSIHSQFSGDTLHMIGNPSQNRRKKLKSFSSEDKQKISRV